MATADLALVLAVDGSASVTYDEFGLIAGGMAAALRHPTVIKGLIGGPAKASYLSLLLWSGSGAHQVIANWTRVSTATEVKQFAEEVDNMSRSVRPGLTAIGEALQESLALLTRVPGKVTRNVVDVIGDGRSNDGIPPGPVRDRMEKAGITINGLCILHEEPDLLAFYQAEVIGGPGAFALTCKDYADFAEAMRRKLTRETTVPIA